MKTIFRLIIIWFGLIGCQSSSEQPMVRDADPADTFACCAVYPDSAEFVPEATPVPMNGSVPILCYHQLREWGPRDSKNARVYIVPPVAFRNEIRLLHDSGYHTVLPDELLAHIQHGVPLPPRPIMLTFDDADGSQITTALPELDRAGFKAVFFVMTVVLDRPNYMSKADVARLVKDGHVVGCHTWDHHMVTKYTEDDWVKQIEKPRQELERITGAPVKFFAYPYGLWNEAAVARLKKYGFTAAFRLAGKSDAADPLFTIGRQIVDGNWNAEQLLKMVSRKEEAFQKSTATPL